DSIFEDDGYILYTSLSPEKDRILVQIANEERMEVFVLSLSGEVLQSRELDTHGYLTADWNPESTHMILLAYHHFDEEEEHLIVENWDIEDNTAETISSPSLELKWYSSNLFLFVDNKEDDTLQEGDLYVGDIRTHEKWRINNEVSSFYLYEDTLVTFTPSDFDDGDRKSTRLNS